MDSLKILNKDVSFIEKQIALGNDLSELLIVYAKPSLKQHLKFFFSLTSLSNAISCSIKMEKFEGEIRKKIKKECYYPIFIFIFAYITLCVFIQFVIPQLLLSFPLETLDTFFTISIYLLKVLCVVIGLTFIVIEGLVLAMKYTKLFDLLIPYVTKLEFAKEYISYTFACYMKELDQDGLSTRKAVMYLSNLQNKKVFISFINSLKDEVEQGRELSNIINKHDYLTSMLKTCFTMGIKTGSLTSALADYVLFQEETWIQKIHRYSTLVQIVSYSFVGFLVIIVYQIMLVPLQLLESM